jgi:hypothetical protein
MAKRHQSGGVNIYDGNVRVQGNLVGRDNYEDHLHLDIDDRDEKGGCVLFIERASAFILTLLIGGAMLGAIGAVVGALVGGGGDDSLVIGAAIGVVLALSVSITNASSISRYRTL